MILSRIEQQRVLLRASKYGIEGDPEELVDQVLQAVVYGQADDAATDVADAAGVDVFGGIWGKRSKRMNAELARAIIQQARKDGNYEAPVPEDDGKAISEAVGLVENAKAAWQAYVRGPEIETILRLAAEAEDMEPNGNGAAQADPGNETVAETPETTAEADPTEDLSLVEPWEGYAEEKLSDIYEGIESAIRTYEPDELRELLAHIWAYENAHKDRVRIMNRLEEVAKRYQEGAEHDKPDTEPQDKPDPEVKPAEPVAEVPVPTGPAAPVEAPPEETPDTPAPTEPTPEPATPEEPEPEPQPVIEQPEEAVETERPAEPEKPSEPEDSVYAELLTATEEALRRENLYVPPQIQEADRKSVV